MATANFIFLERKLLPRAKPAELPSLKNPMQGWRINGRRKAAQEVHLDGFTEPDGELYRDVANANPQVGSGAARSSNLSRELLIGI